MVADIGGSTVDEATRRMMAFLLDHSLSREYNFVGRHGKREFRGLKLFEVIYSMFIIVLFIFARGYSAELSSS